MGDKMCDFIFKLKGFFLDDISPEKIEFFLLFNFVNKNTIIKTRLRNKPTPPSTMNHAHKPDVETVLLIFPDDKTWSEGTAMPNMKEPARNCAPSAWKPSTWKIRALQRNSTSKFTFQIGISWGYQITISKYPWEKKNCIKKKCNEHIITYSKPHGVLGTCTCGEIQSYNWKM